MENQLGFAAVLSNKTLSGGLPSTTTIFTAIMYVIKNAIENSLKKISGSYAISQPLKVYGWPSNHMPVTAMVTINSCCCNQASVKEVHTGLCWVPGHTCVVENKHVNTSAAKSATTNVDRLLPTIAISHTQPWLMSGKKH